MRNLLLIAAASVLLGGIGCASEEEQRRERNADLDQMWEGRDHMPDKILGMGEFTPQTPTKTKVPATLPPAPVVQVSMPGTE